MNRYIGRQPIFDQNVKVQAYELLYRSGQTAQANVQDGDVATKNLLSDAVTVFGLPNLTNAKPAFVNMTENLLLSEFIKLINPKEVVVEILEDVKVSPELIGKLQELKQLGYRLALDDYVGDPQFDPILPLMDIIKVDFMLSDAGQQSEIGRRFKGKKVNLLAEKVETADEFEMAKKWGYSLFQGYFFAKPVVINQRASKLSAASYIRLFHEINKKNIDIPRCAEIIHADVNLTYQLFRKVRTMRYYRGNSIQSIKMALMIIGTDELHRWILLLLAREGNITRTDESVRQAYLRATFIEALMERSRWDKHSSTGFLIGMFSLLDKIIGRDMENILEELPMEQSVTNVLLGESENVYSYFLDLAIAYEEGKKITIRPELDLQVKDYEIADIYMQCIVEADKAFNL